MRISYLYENTARFSTTYSHFSTTKRSYDLTEVPRSLMLLPLIHRKVLDEALDLALLLMILKVRVASTSSMFRYD